MDLEYYRLKRQVIVEGIEKKHNDWLLHVSDEDFCEYTEKKIRGTIEEMYNILAECDDDIRRVKEELIEAHYNV